MGYLHLRLIVEDFDGEHEGELSNGRILPIEDLFAVVMDVEIYEQYFPVDTYAINFCLIYVLRGVPEIT